MSNIGLKKCILCKSTPTPWSFCLHSIKNKVINLWQKKIQFYLFQNKIGIHTVSWTDRVCCTYFPSSWPTSYSSRSSLFTCILISCDRVALYFLLLTNCTAVSNPDPGAGFLYYHLLNCICSLSLMWISLFTKLKQTNLFSQTSWPESHRPQVVHCELNAGQMQIHMEKNLAFVCSRLIRYCLWSSKRLSHCWV